MKFSKSGLAALTADSFNYSLESLQTIQMYGVDFTSPKCIGVSNYVIGIALFIVAFFIGH